MLEDNNEMDIRDRVQLWLEQNGHYDLSLRIALVPEEIVRQLLKKTPEAAEKILDENGY